MYRPTLSLTLAGLLLLVSGCRDSDEEGLAARLVSAAGGPAAALPSEPAPADLLLPPPPDAVFERELSGAVHAHVAAMGGNTRQRRGTGGTWTGEDGQVFLFSTGLSLEEAREHFAQAFGWGEGDIEEEGMPDPGELEAQLAYFEGAGADLDLPETYVDALRGWVVRYREAYPRIRDLRQRTVNVSATDERPGVDSYRHVEVEIAYPFLDPDFEIHDRVMIMYTVTTMHRQD